MKNDIITFEDPRIEKRVRAALRQAKGDLLVADVATIKKLDLTYLGIVDPSGLAALTGLQTLWLDGNQIVDPSGLAALKLTRIYGVPRVGRR
jgi:hypothetical protein